MLLVRRNGRDKAVAVASCAVASIACARLIPSRLASSKEVGEAVRRWGGTPRVLARTDESVSSSRPLAASRDTGQPDSRIETMGPASCPSRALSGIDALRRHVLPPRGFAQTSETFHSRVEPAGSGERQSASSDESLQPAAGSKSTIAGNGGPVKGPQAPLYFRGAPPDPGSPICVPRRCGGCRCSVVRNRGAASRRLNSITARYSRPTSASSATLQPIAVSPPYS